MNNEDSINKIKEDLEKLWSDLLLIQTESKQYSTPAEYGKERLSRWENRLKACISENVSKEEAEELNNKKYPISIIGRMDDPFKNFDSKISSLKSYVANLIKDLQENSEYWDSIIQEANTNIDVTYDLSPLDKINLILDKFHVVATQLIKRYSNRGTLIINDEYDIQDLLHALLRIYFNDIRPEEWTPSYAGSSNRMDFLLKQEKIVIETKYASANHNDKEIGKELIEDRANYKKHQDCNMLVCFIYDKEYRITNRDGLINDIERDSDNQFQIKVIIKPNE